jgi:hypothetical protein
MSRSAVRVRSSALFFTLFCRENAKRRKGPGDAAGPIYTHRTLTCLGKCAVHSRSGLVLHSRLHVTVDAERHAEAGIAQGILDSELHNHLSDNTPYSQLGKEGYVGLPARAVLLGYSPNSLGL